MPEPPAIPNRRMLDDVESLVTTLERDRGVDLARPRSARDRDPSP
jgi:hypothetical protein